MTLKAVFIDVGNTLLFEQPSRFEIYAESARKRGAALDAAKMRQLMVRAHGELPRVVGGAFRYSEEWFEAYIERIFSGYLRLPESELPALMKEIFGRFARADTFVPFPGAPELLAALRERGLVIGVISNWSTRLPKLLEALGLSSRVDFVLCSAIERLEKPDPMLFQRALERAGVRADEAIHAGDDVEKDFLGARGAGLSPVLVDHFDSKPRGDVVGGARVSSLYELDRWIAREAG